MPQSEDWCARLVGDGPDALVTVDTDGIVVFANRRAEELFGHPPGGLLGLGLRALLADSSGATRENPLDPLAETGQLGANLDLYGRRADDSTFPIEVNYSRLPDSDHVAASVRDVSHRQRTESELRDALSLLSATLQSTADGILVVTADGRIAARTSVSRRCGGSPRTCSPRVTTSG